MSGLAWVDGALVPRDAPAIPVDDFGFRYGAACFETMLARRGRVFRLEAHLDRLEAGLLRLGVGREPARRSVLADAIAETIVANRLADGDAAVRLEVSAGTGTAPDLAAARTPRVVIVVEAVGLRVETPVRLRVASVRLDERRPLREAKTSQFLPYLLARAEARAAGADDALLLTRAGSVSEAGTSNLFVLLDGVLATPRLEDGPVPGITRAAVIEVARGLGVAVRERRLRLGDLARTEGAWLTNSVQGLRAVGSVVGDLPVAPLRVRWRARASSSAFGRRLGAAYEALVEAETAG